MLSIERLSMAEYSLDMKYWMFSVIMGVALTGCAQVEGLFDREAASAPAASNDSADAEQAGAQSDDSAQTATVSVATARTADGFDTSTNAERAEAVAAAQTTSGAAELGTTIASLGAPTEPGFWLKTPLTDRPGKGRVDYPDKGTSVVVDLIPLDVSPGAGSQISLAAMRLIEADLTGLPEVRVFRLPE